MCTCGEDGIKVENNKLYAFDQEWYLISNSKFCPFCGEKFSNEIKNDNVFLQYEKILTINDEHEQVIKYSINFLLDFMYKKSQSPEYFRIRLKNSEKSPFSKDLLLEWCELTPKNKNAVIADGIKEKK